MSERCGLIYEYFQVSSRDCQWACSIVMNVWWISAWSELVGWVFDSNSLVLSVLIIYSSGIECKILVLLWHLVHQVHISYNIPVNPLIMSMIIDARGLEHSLCVHTCISVCISSLIEILEMFMLQWKMVHWFFFKCKNINYWYKKMNKIYFKNYHVVQNYLFLL